MEGNGGFRWPAGKRVAVSLTLDDARPSQVDVGLPVLARHGTRATFYVSIPRLTQRMERWQAASAAGHEIGNHSLQHPCTANFRWGTANVLERYTLATMEEELLEANRRLSELFGVVPRTFAYPCGQDFVGVGVDRSSYVPVVARHFRAGRGFRDEYVNAPEVCDLARLGGTELDGVSAAEMLSALDRFCVFCADPANGVWIDTVASIAEYVAANRR
jgi:hypothetical protein